MKGVNHIFPPPTEPRGGDWDIGENNPPPHVPEKPGVRSKERTCQSGQTGQKGPMSPPQWSNPLPGWVAEISCRGNKTDESVLLTQS